MRLMRERHNRPHNRPGVCDCEILGLEQQMDEVMRCVTMNIDRILVETTVNGTDICSGCRRRVGPGTYMISLDELMDDPTIRLPDELLATLEAQKLHTHGFTYNIRR